MVVAGTRDAVLMVESEADELTEDQMLGGVLFAHEEFQVAIEAISQFAAEAASRPGNGRHPPRTPPWSRPSRPRSARPCPVPTHHHQAGRYAALGALRDQAIASWPARTASTAKPRSRRPSVCWNTAPCARTSSTASRVSTAATPAPFARCRSKSAPEEDPRFGAVHPWRNPGPGHRDPGYRPRCPTAGHPGRRAS